MTPTSDSSAARLKAEAQRNDWKLDLWPWSSFEPTGEARLKIGQATLSVRGSGLDADALADRLLEALGEIAWRMD